MQAPCPMWLQRFKSLLTKPCWRDDVCMCDICIPFIPGAFWSFVLKGRPALYLLAIKCPYKLCHCGALEL